MIGLGIGVGVTGISTVAGTPAPTYDAASTAYFAAMSAQPDATRKGLIDALIAGLKTDGVWAGVDFFTLPGAHDAQAGLVNAANPAQVATITGTMTFTTDRGYAGDGSTGYISTVTGADSWTHFTQNSLSFGVWLNSNPSPGLVMGQATGTSLRLTPTQGTQMQSRCGSSTASIIGTNAAATGLFMSDRSDSVTGNLFLNGALLTTQGSYASTAPSADPVLVNRVATVYSTARAAAIILAGSLDATKQAALYARLNTYLTAIGAA